MAFYSNRVSMLVISTLAFLGPADHARGEETRKRRLHVVSPTGHMKTLTPLLTVEAAPSVRLVIPVGATSRQTYSLIIETQPDLMREETHLEVAWMKAARDPKTKRMHATDIVAGGSDITPAIWEAKPSDFDPTGKTYLIAQYKVLNINGGILDRGERVIELIKREVAPLPQHAFDVPERAMPLQAYRLQTKVAHARSNLRPGDRWEVEWTKGLRDPLTQAVYMTGLISRATDKINATWLPDTNDFDHRGHAVILANYRIYDEHDNIVVKGLHTFDVEKINPPKVFSVQCSVEVV